MTFALPISRSARLARTLRRLALVPLCLSLAACGGLGVGSDEIPSPRNNRAKASERFTQMVQSGRPLMQVTVQRKELAGFAVREVQRDGVDTYMSADGIALKLRDGFLVGTAGFGGDMLGSNVSDSMALILRRRGGTAERFHTFLNGENQAVTRTYLCVVSRRDPRNIDVATRAGTYRSVATALMKEDCKSLDQSFSNLYWISFATGRVVQSRQWAGDFTGPLVMQQVIE
ncbi:YjbF family lipoprotein [Oceanicola sp. 502str15]|uniref:YjbF family lipoprotein n=1 Tax=Oceanicola sp. 502str15 TaxID=2696061 RepID=UPI0020944C62|nr:YjbF family lipoprotein [Oceanicola sp. 502str15]MCO6382907.1 YjbF family lipoprotein [Oceanicola sp. 502str15]